MPDGRWNRPSHSWGSRMFEYEHRRACSDCLSLNDTPERLRSAQRRRAQAVRNDVGRPAFARRDAAQHCDVNRGRKMI